MARLTRAAIFAGAAACSRPAPQSPPPPPVEYPFALPPAPAEGRASLSGVVREDGYRKAGVLVKLESENRDVELNTRTNDKGEFQFLDLAPGVYVLLPSPGYQNPRPQDGPVAQQPVTVQLGANANERRDLFLVGPEPYTPDTGPCCKPYGAPPARRRIV